MGRVLPEIDAALQSFIEAQQVFFVATAPLSAGGHVNVSPKGLDTLRVLGATRLAYLDYVGSGAETIAHLRENARIVVMVCAFQGSPRIVRFHGRGEVLSPETAEYQRLRPLFPPTPDGRAIVVVEVTRIAESCGFGVPIYENGRERSQLVDWAERQGPDALEDYQRRKNGSSLDDLPAVTWLSVVKQ
jgi:hypothetical protein